MGEREILATLAATIQWRCTRSIILALELAPTSIREGSAHETEPHWREGNTVAFTLLLPKPSHRCPPQRSICGAPP